MFKILLHNCPKKNENVDILFIRYLHSRNLNLANDNTKHFACPSKILAALSWLKENNPLYANVDINEHDSECKPSYMHNISDIMSDLEQFATTPINCTLPNASVTNYLKTGFIDVPHITDKPVSVYELDCGEEMAFPWLFPTGKNGYNFDRPIKITRSMYFKQRLYHKTGYFRKDLTYLLHAAVSVDFALLKSEINVNMKITKGLHNREHFTVGDLKNMNESNAVGHNSYMFMKNIRELLHILEINYTIC